MHYSSKTINFQKSKVKQHLSQKCHKKKNQKLNVIIFKNKTKSKLATYLHACCFSPTQSTCICGIKNGNFISWPGLTDHLIFKMSPSINTSKGHLTQEISNLQSTKIKNTITEDYFSKSNTPNIKKNTSVHQSDN